MRGPRRLGILGVACLAVAGMSGLAWAQVYPPGTGPQPGAGVPRPPGVPGAGGGAMIGRPAGVPGTGAMTGRPAGGPGAGAMPGRSVGDPGAQMLIGHALCMAIDGSMLQLASQRIADQQAEAASELRDQARSALDGSNRLFGQAREVLSNQGAGAGAGRGPGAGDNGASGIAHLLQVAEGYAQSLRSLAGVPGNQAAPTESGSAPMLSEADFAELLVINHAVKEVLQAGQLTQVVRFMGPGGAAIRQLQAHAQERDAEGRQALEREAAEDSEAEAPQAAPTEPEPPAQPAPSDLESDPASSGLDDLDELPATPDAPNSALPPSNVINPDFVPTEPQAFRSVPPTAPEEEAVPSEEEPTLPLDQPEAAADEEPVAPAAAPGDDLDPVMPDEDLAPPAPGDDPESRAKIRDLARQGLEVARALQAASGPAVLPSAPRRTLPGQVVPGTLPRRATGPGTTAPRTTIPGSTVPGVNLPGTTVPGTTVPGTTVPGSVTPPGAVRPGSVTPGSVIPGVPGNILPRVGVPTPPPGAGAGNPLP